MVKLVSTSPPEGFDCVDEYVNLYNTAGVTLYRGDCAVLDLENAAKPSTTPSGLSSPWATVRLASATSAGCCIMGVSQGSSLTANQLGRFQLRGKEVALRPSTGGAPIAYTRGMLATPAVGFPGCTMAAPSGNTKVMGIALTDNDAALNGGTSGSNNATRLITCFFDGVNGLR